MNNDLPYHQYPPALVAKCQKVISQKAGIKISEDQAVLYLEKFARLMRVTVKIMQQVNSKNKSYGKNYPNR
jgi:hypothetical protein